MTRTLPGKAKSAPKLGSYRDQLMKNRRAGLKTMAALAKRKAARGPKKPLPKPGLRKK